MIFGYARVSSTDQNLDSQIEKLKQEKVDQIISEKISGIALKREKLDQLLNTLNEGDTLVVTRMDRLGRNTHRTLELIELLEEKNVYLTVLDLGIDTSKPTGKFILTVMAAFAELDRMMIKEKQAAGIAIAKKKGIYKGRKRTYDENHKGIKQALYLRETTNMSVTDICNVTCISRATFYRRLNEKNKP